MHAKITDDSDPEQHSMWLRECFEQHDAEYEFKVQLCQRLREQSVEDMNLPWNEAAFPFQTVGKVVIPKGQDSFSSEGRTFWEEHWK